MNETHSFTLYGDPKTKKNSGKIVYKGQKCPVCRKGKLPIVLPSDAYIKYVEDVKDQVPVLKEPISYPVNIKAIFYKETRGRVDKLNLQEGLDDLLVACGFLKDDNCTIVVSHDGSRVHWDKDNPRVEVLIEPTEETSF